MELLLALTLLARPDGAVRARLSGVVDPPRAARVCVVDDARAGSPERGLSGFHLELRDAEGRLLAFADPAASHRVSLRGARGADRLYRPIAKGPIASADI